MLQLKKFLNNKSGFTILEVVIALAIMTVAFGAILAVEQGSINASLKAKQMNVVAMLARNQMVETEFQMTGKTFGEVSKESEGRFERPYEDYRWKTTIKEIEFPQLMNAASVGASESGLTGSSGGGMAEMVAKLMSSFLSKAIREVNVTIFWKRGKSEQNFNLTTYWVDLNHEFKLSQ